MVPVATRNAPRYVRRWHRNNLRALLGLEIVVLMLKIMCRLRRAEMNCTFQRGWPGQRGLREKADLF